MSFRTQYEPMGGEFVKEASREVRLGFIKKVYGILTVQLISTVIVATPVSLTIKSIVTRNPALAMSLMIGSLVLSVTTICAMTCCPGLTRSFPTNYIMLGVFTITESILVGATCARYPPELVLGCAAATAVIFLGLTMYAWTTKSDFTGCGPYLFAALLGMLVVSCGILLMQMLVPGANTAVTQKLFAGLMVILFTMYIVYDTQLMIGEFKGHAHQFEVDDYVFAALNLYLDILNLFLYLLDLFGDRK